MPIGVHIPKLLEIARHSKWSFAKLLCLQIDSGTLAVKIKIIGGDDDIAGLSVYSG
jgi:hypothetical protein